MPTALAHDRTLGSPDAPVSIDLWADFQCPGCMQLANRVEPPLVTQFVEQGWAKITFHDAAFQGTGSYDKSVEAAAAARCAADQGKFWQMHDWLFANSGERVGAFLPDKLTALAEAAGLDVTAYASCMATGDKQAAVRQDTNDAVAMGINSTPTLLIDGSPYTGAVTVADIGDAIVAAAGGASPAPIAAL